MPPGLTQLSPTNHQEAWPGAQLGKMPGDPLHPQGPSSVCSELGLCWAAWVGPSAGPGPSSEQRLLYASRPPPHKHPGLPEDHQGANAGCQLRGQRPGGARGGHG